MTNSEKLIINLVLEAAAQKPLPERVGYYRALASLTTDDTAVENFIRMAEALEASELQCQQMHLDFHQRILNAKLLE